MQRFVALWTLLGVGSVFLGVVACASPERVTLFNGRDLTGWQFVLRDQSVDPATVWSVSDGVIHCTGRPSGYMRTVDDYADYKLHVEWRWPERVGNSGVLVHMSLPDNVWPRSIEAQLNWGDAGDLWVIGGAEFAEHVEPSTRRTPKRARSSENPVGEWNTYEIICLGNTMKVYVNGRLQNEATEMTISSGKICLQSEGRPVEFRNVYLEQLN